MAPDEKPNASVAVANAQRAVFESDACRPPVFEPADLFKLDSRMRGVRFPTLKAPVGENLNSLRQASVIVFELV